ncbi:MAG: hypothetical protein HFF26_02075 [Oscillospiraceae bacterium]|nr:hypothetical protein [Oscillospiraceae bacterium]
MLTAGQIDALRGAADQIAGPIGEYLIRDIVRRIAEAGQLTSTAAYQIWRAQTLGVSQRALKKELRRRLGLTHQEIRRIFYQSAQAGYELDVSRFPQVQAIPFAQNAVLQQIVSAAAELAEEGFTNLTQTLGMVDPRGRALPLQKAYRACTDFAFQQVITGAASYTEAIRQATRHLAAKGVRVIDYKSGAHTSLEAAVRRNILGGLGLMQEQISQTVHEQLGCDGWEIDAHANSAPDHEPIQGKQYPDVAYEALNNSLVRRINTLNCGHSAFPIILGVNRPQYTPEELEKFRADNEKGVTVDGVHYTGYQATQMQRKLEQAIRDQKRRVMVDETAGDKERLAQDQTKLTLLRQRYAEFSKAAGLRTQHERTEVAGFGERNKRVPESAKAVEISEQSDRMISSERNGAAPVQEIARIDLSKYQCISTGIRSNLVVLTDNQMEHIIKRRGVEFWERYQGHFKEILEDPDYIFADKQHENTAVACKIFIEDGKTVQLVIRLALVEDDPKLQNSIITAILESNKRFAQRLRNNQPLYKKE